MSRNNKRFVHLNSFLSPFRYGLVLYLIVLLIDPKSRLPSKINVTAINPISKKAIILLFSEWTSVVKRMVKTTRAIHFNT
jgi:hypothetical protein